VENGAKFKGADTPSLARQRGHDSLVVTRIGLNPLPHLSHLNISLSRRSGVPTSALWSGIRENTIPGFGSLKRFGCGTNDPAGRNSASYATLLSNPMEEIDRKQDEYDDDENGDEHPDPPMFAGLYGR
jgi:hypothetical protein